MTLDEFLKLPGAKVHDGGPCPVDLESFPIVLCRDGHIYLSQFKARQYGGLWRNKETSATRAIIAYREVQP